MEQYEYCNGPPAPRMVAELAMRHDALVKQLADAQATIAALQARVQELEQAVKETHGRFISEQAAKKDVIEELTVALKSNADGQVLIDKLMQDVLKLEAQLTQRTAELEVAKRERDSFVQRCEELSEIHCDLHEKNKHLQAELERVRGEQQQAWLHFTLCNSHADFIDDLGALLTDHYTLRTLILALPKVEGEIEIRTLSAPQRYALQADNFFLIGFATQGEADTIAELYRERQRMQ